MPSEEIEKYRMMEAEKVYRATIRDWLIGSFKNATWDQVRSFIWSFCPPDAAMIALLKDINRWEKEGKNPLECVVNEKEGRLLRDDLLYSSARYSAQLDALSFIASRVPPEDTTGTIAWHNLSTGYYLSPYEDGSEDGGYLTIHGLPRMGKTGVACDIGELWLDAHPGCEILTNVPLLHEVDRVRAAINGETLATGIAHALIARRKWHWIWDEPNLSKYGKSDAATGVSHNLNRFVRIIPKLGGSLTYIEHLEEGTPSVIQAFAQFSITAMRPGFIIADLREKRSIRAVPMPKRIAYRTGQPGYFDLEDGFDWTGFFQALRFHPEDIRLEDGDASEQGNRILAFLERERHKPPKRGPGRPRKDENESKLLGEMTNV